MTAPLSLSVKPKVIRINRWLTAILVGIILIIFVVIVYSITQTSHHQSQKTVLVEDTDETEQSTARWYERVAQSTNTKVEDEATPTNNRLEQSTIMSPNDAPLKIQSNITQQATIAEDNETQTDLSHAALPLTKQQVSKLAMLYDKKNTLSDTVKTPLSPFIIQAGTYIPATMIGGIQSELPGEFVAQVSHDIYDSLDGRYVLIPQGTKLLLRYDNKLNYAQGRLFIVAERLIAANGTSLDLNDMPVVDESGYAGLKDKINHHYFKLYGHAAALGMIQASMKQMPISEASSYLTTETNGAVEQLGQVSANMMNKNLDVPYTLTIRSGFPFYVLVTKDIVFPGPYNKKLSYIP